MILTVDEWVILTDVVSVDRPSFTVENKSSGEVITNSCTPVVRGIAGKVWRSQSCNQTGNTRDNDNYVPKVWRVFHLRDALYSAVCAIVRCPSVRLSVKRRYCIERLMRFSRQFPAMSSLCKKRWLSPPKLPTTTPILALKTAWLLLAKSINRVTSSCSVARRREPVAWTLTVSRHRKIVKVVKYI